MSEITELAIRPVEGRDVPAVIEHVRATLAEFGLAFGVGAATDAELADLPDSYARRRGAFFVVERGGEIAGTAGVCETEPGVFELRKMYLRPDARGRGLGRALLERAIAHARSAGARAITLDTTEAMTGAIRLYERAGFVRDDRYITAPRCSRGYILRLSDGPGATATTTAPNADSPSM